MKSVKPFLIIFTPFPGMGLNNYSANDSYLLFIEVKSAYKPSGPHINTTAYPGFLSMKRVGVFLLPPGWDAGPSQGYPQQ